MTKRPFAHAPGGFSMLELMIVIVILGLLATIVTANVMPMLDRGNVEKARADISVLEQAIEQYRMDMSGYPSPQEGLQALMAVPTGAANANRYREGGYIRRLPKDPWGNPYQYRQPGEQGGAFDVFSLGADGQPGGEGDDADIGNWR